MMRITALLSLAFALALGAAACGDDTSKEEQTTSQSELTEAEREAAHATQTSGPGGDSVVKHSAELGTGCPGCGPLPDPWTAEKSGPLPDPWKATGGGGSGGTGSSTQTGTGNENPHK